MQIGTRRRSASSPLGSETDFARLPKKGWADGDSAKGKSDEKIGLRHSTEKEAGTLAVLLVPPVFPLSQLQVARSAYSRSARRQHGLVADKQPATVWVRRRGLISLDRRV